MAPAKKSNQGSVETPKQGKVPPIFEPLTVFFDKKLRNLEKRKAKLLSLKTLQKEGKLVDVGQLEAVKKCDEVEWSVAYTSNILQELLPVLLEISNNIEKAAIDKENEKQKSYKSVIRSVLDTQDIYEQLGDEVVRSHFAAGSDNAIHLSKRQIEAIDNLYASSKPSRSNVDGSFKSSSEYRKSLDESVSSWYSLLCRPEQSKGKKNTKSEDMKMLFENISNCGYFDASQLKIEDVKEEAVHSEPPTMEDNPQEEEANHDQEPESHVQETLDNKALPSDILGSLQGRVVNFVQDDFGHNPNSIAPVATNIVAGSTDAEVAFNGGFQEAYTGITTNMANMGLENNRQPFGHFNGNSMPEETIGNNVMPPELNNNKSLFSSNAPQGTFPAAESWADEAPEMFDSNLNSGGDSFVEVKRGGGMNNRYGGRNNDYGRGGHGGYRDYHRGGLNRGGNRGFESRGGGFNRPYRNDYRDDQNQGGRQDYYRGGGRGYGSGGGGFPRGGRGNRGDGRPIRGGGFDRPQQTFTSANASSSAK